MKKSVFVLVSSALALSAALAGCAGSQNAGNSNNSNSQQAGGEKKEMVMHYNFAGEIPSADPGLGTDNQSLTFALNTFEGLTRLDKDGKYQPAGAESWDISPDGLTYTFKLRKDAKWSNGDPVTAHDYEFEWKRVLNPKTAAEYAYQLYYIKGAEAYNKGKGKVEDVGVKALDDYTLQVTLANKTPFFIELTSFPTYYPVHKATAEKNENWAADAKTFVSNGPFTMESWEHKNKLVLKKNPYYFDAAKVKLDRIECTLIDDDNTAQAKFDNGELDFGGYPSYSLPVDLIPKLKQEGKLSVEPEPGTNAVIFNTQKPPFNNKKIRRAFALAMNRQDITDNVIQVGQTPAFGWVPPSMALKPEGYFQENVEEAKKLLAEGMKELGLTKFPEVTYKYNTGDQNKKIAEALQDQWKKNLGIDVKLENEEWKVFLKDRTSGNYQLGRYAWGADFNDPINFLELFKDKDGGNNDADYDNPQFRDLLNKSYAESDPAKRKELLLQAETILMDDMPLAPLSFRANGYINNEKLKGWHFNPVGGVLDLKEAYLEQ